MSHLIRLRPIISLGLAVFLMAICFPCAESLGQELPRGDDADAEKLFQEAVASYGQADYYHALIGFRSLLRDFAEHRRVTAALLMQAKCYYWLHNFGQATESLQVLFTQFDRSSYLDNAHYLLGNCHYRQGHYWQAADQFRQVIEMTDVPALAALARDCLRVLMTSDLSLGQLRQLYDLLPDDQLSPWILLEIAERELAAGHREETLVAADQILRLFPGTEAAGEAQRIKEYSAGAPDQPATIGVLCPLSGPYANYGKELRFGVEQAVEEHNTASQTKVLLVVKDSQASPVNALQATKSLIAEDRVLAIIGPLLSSVAVGAGTASDYLGVPLITPTGSEGNIAAIGKFIFQRSVGAAAMSRQMAAYAVEEMKLGQFAVLAPGDEYGNASVIGFCDEINKRGGEILAVARYQAGATDFKDQLIQIRRRKQAQDDSLKALGLLPASQYPAEPDTIPPDERRVYIDAIFIPAYPDEAGMIAPQLAFHRLEAQILGTSAWGNRGALRIGGEYLEGTVFATDFSEELFTEEYDRFAVDYRVRHGNGPGKVAVFSYECAKLVLEGIDTGIRGREALYQYLSQIEHHPGLMSPISFTGDNGANDEAMILTIQDGQVIKLQ